jgi:thiamine kinase-like enzyme
LIYYIRGKNLCDIINSKDTSFNSKLRIIIFLAKWFIKFHDYFKIQKKFFIRGDSNLRNFLYNNQIWGVDFEESRFGEPEEDIACMCSSILSTNPMFTEDKFQLCDTFIESYSEIINCKIEKLNEMISNKLIKNIQWRSKDEHILRKYAYIIRKKGLL